MSEQRPARYEFDDLPLPGVPPGSSILVAGDSMSGARQAGLELVAAATDHDEGMILVSPDKGASRTLDALDRVRDDLDHSRLGVIDCSGEEAEVDSPARVESISSPDDLTGIGIRFSGLYETFHAEGIPRVRTGVTSVSLLLMYSEVRTVFRFLHTVVGRIGSAGGLGVFVLDPGSHEDRSVNMIGQLFDVRIEARTTDDGTRQLRSRGLSEGPTGWTDY